MKKRYIITGAAGHLGSTIIRLLKDTGCKIYGLLLPDEVPVVENSNIHYVRGDVCRTKTLSSLFADSDEDAITVIHAAGIISISQKVSPLMQKVNVDGTKNMVQICKEKGVDRFVYVSSVHAIPEKANHDTICEVGSFSPDSVTGGYAKTKAEASQIVMNASKNGFPAVIVHPSGIIGPYDNGKNHLIQLVSEYISGKLHACVKGGYDFVDARDVAKGCLLAAEKGETGQCYILSGHYFTIKELLARVGNYCNKKPLPTVPMPIVKLLAPCVEAFASMAGKRPLFTRYSLYTLSSNGKFSNQKARTELGYVPRGIDDTIRDMTNWIMKNATASSL